MKHPTASKLWCTIAMAVKEPVFASAGVLSEEDALRALSPERRAELEERVQQFTSALLREMSGSTESQGSDNHSG